MFLVNNKKQERSVKTTIMYTQTTLIHDISNLACYLGVEVPTYTPTEHFDEGFSKGSMVILYIQDVSDWEMEDMSSVRYESLLKSARNIYVTLDMLSDSEIVELTGTNNQFAVAFRNRSKAIWSFIDDQKECFN